MDLWTAAQIDYYLGDIWTGMGNGAGSVAYSAAPIAEASAPGTRPKGNPQHNGTTDLGLVLVAVQDCHKANTDKTIFARYPSYSLRLPDKTTVPQPQYTVFEFIPQTTTNCGVGGFGNLNPCKYADGSSEFPFNRFDDEISLGLAGGSMNRSQYFLYGLPKQRLYGVKSIYRTMPDGSLQAKRSWNQLTASADSDPLIDGQLDPWLAPWDGLPASCNSSGSLYFP